MKLRILLITAVLAVSAQGTVFAKGIIEERITKEYDDLTEQVYACLGTGDQAAAIPLLKRMNELKPEELIPFEYLGVIYANLLEERPELSNALFWLTEAEKRGSSNNSVYYNLACIYSLKGEIEKAEATMNKALAMGYYNFKWISQDYDLVNFRTGFLWEGIADNYTQIEQLLTLFNEYYEDEENIEDNITFYSGIVTALKELAPHIPALQIWPLLYLASSYGDNNNYTSAEQNYFETQTICENVLGKEHPYYNTIKNSIEILYKNMETYATLVNIMGLAFDGMGDYAKAEDCFLEAQAVWAKTLGKEHPDYAKSLNNLGTIYLKMGDYTKSESYFLEAKEIWEKVHGKEHPDYAASLNNLGALYESMGDYVKAESYYLEVKSIWEKVYGKENPEYAKSLNNLGSVYRSMSDYTKAKSCLLEAISIQEKVLGKEHPDYATSLGNLGAVYSFMGDYAKAESYFLQEKTIRENVQGKEHPDYASSINSLGELYNSMGDYAKAESCFLEAKAIWEKVHGKEHPKYADSLDNMGWLYYIKGDYANAESCYLEAITIHEKVQGKDHPSYADSLNKIGTLYMDMGDYANAENCYQEAMAIFEKVHGKEHPTYANLLNSMGILYKNMSDYVKAESYLLEAKTIWEKIHSKEHPSYATLLTNLGLLYDIIGDYTKAESCFLEARAIMEKVQHPYYGVLIHNMGFLYMDMGDYAKAENCLLEAKSIWEKALGKNHPYYAVSLGNLCVLYLSKKDYMQALAYKQEQIKINTSIVNKNFSFQTEQQRDAYWNDNSSSFEGSYSLSFFYPVPESNILNYENTLFTKGLLLRTTNAIRDAIYASDNQTLISQFEELTRKRQQISALRQSGGNETYISSLESEAETLEKSLTQSSREFREFQTDLAVNWQSVQNSLQPNEVAIEFVSFKIYENNWTDTVQYAALVLRPGMTAPEWVPLCEENALTELFSKLDGIRPQVQARLLYDEYGPALYDAVWRPLEKILTNITTVYYSPSGLLHKVAFNAIPVNANTRLMDKYSLNLVSSTREVVYLKNKTAVKPGSAVVYGGLNYTVDADTMRKEALAYNIQGTRSGSERDGLSVVNTENYQKKTTGETTWGYLQFTDKESNDIYQLLAINKVPSMLLNGVRGNKESFLALNGKKTVVIHLATHGFFNQDIKKNYEEQGRIQQIGGRQKAIENPLRRSGLILAGANTWAKNPVEGTENGILLADEVAGMNLLGADLIVLSACETALGEVNNSEGVFGLQRAFKLAGAQTLIMSLWKVDDEATSILISTFYKNWLSGKSKQDAFKEAQRSLRSNSRYASPFYWAAFVMMD